MKTIRGRAAVETQAADVLSDESKYRLGVPEAVFYPESVTDVCTVVTEARCRGVPLTIAGGRTGITGGSVPVDGCYAVCFSAMNRILEVSADADGSPVLTCQPGVTIADIDRFLRDPPVWPARVPGAERVADGRWFYPPDPTETSAQLGGTVAANASGARSFRYGATRAHVTALSIVLADGQTASIKRGAGATNETFHLVTDQGSSLTIPRPTYRSPCVKNASGYYSSAEMDLVDLLTGSEGTLAILTGVTVRLSRRPTVASGLTFLPTRAAALDVAAFLRAESQVMAVEFFDSTSLSFIAARRSTVSAAIPPFPLPNACAIYWEYDDGGAVRFEERMDAWDEQLRRHGASFDLTWGGFEPAELQRLKALRHCLPELVNNEIARHQRACASIRKISTDCAVPAAAFDAVFSATHRIIAEADLAYVCFGHLGDYHLHFNVIPRDKPALDRGLAVYKQVMQLAIDAKGTVSAEHGIGKLKVDYLAAMFGDQAIAEMRAIKAAFDPRGMLNPGNLFR